MKKLFLPFIAAAILLLGARPDAYAIDVYRFLVQYTNGRTVEKTSSETPEGYKKYFNEYVSRVVLLDKKKFTPTAFVKQYGYDNYIRFAQGRFFIEGDEEEVMLKRIFSAAKPDPSALPEPDERSAALTQKLQKLISRQQ